MQPQNSCLCTNEVMLIFTTHRWADDMTRDLRGFTHSFRWKKAAYAYWLFTELKSIMKCFL